MTTFRLPTFSDVVEEDVHLWIYEVDVLREWCAKRGTDDILTEVKFVDFIDSQRDRTHLPCGRTRVAESDDGEISDSSSSEGCT